MGLRSTWRNSFPHSAKGGILVAVVVVLAGGLTSAQLVANISQDDKGPTNVWLLKWRDGSDLGNNVLRIFTEDLG